MENRITNQVHGLTKISDRNSTMTPPFTVDPLFRIQVLFENETGAPTKEFKAGDLSALTFDALLEHTFAMSLPNEEKDLYDFTFKYRLEERHSSRWVNFEDTQGFAYAFQSNQDKGYVYISACIIRKGAAAPIFSPPVAAVGRSTTSTTTKAKSKVAKKASPTKAKVSARSGGGGEEAIITALKTLLDIGNDKPQRKQVMLFSGYKNLKSFGNVVTKLIKAGLVEYPDSKTICLTEAGIAKAGSTTRQTSNESVHDTIRSLLNGTQTKIFNLLADGSSRNKQEMAAELGLQIKSFGNCVSAMSSLGFLKYVEDDSGKKNSIRLADIAFPLGRANSDGSDDAKPSSVVSSDDISIG